MENQKGEKVTTAQGCYYLVLKDFCNLNIMQKHDNVLSL